MATIEASIQIARPVETVFAFITNPENLKTLQPGVIEVEVSGPLTVGAHYTLKGQVMGSEFNVLNEIVTLDSNRKFAVKTHAAPPVVNTYSLTANGSGTLLTSSMETIILGGFPGVEEMVRNQLKATLDNTNANLKNALES